jgi:hypothetical protein
VGAIPSSIHEGRKLLLLPAQHSDPHVWRDKVLDHKLIQILAACRKIVFFDLFKNKNQ